MYINLLCIKKLSHQAVYVSEGHSLSCFCTLGLFQTSFVDVFGSHPRFTKLADLDGISFYSLCSFVRIIINSEWFTVGRLALNFRN